MTAQIHDRFRYQGTVYSMVGMQGLELFSPVAFGLHPARASTACWRGYQAVFAIADAQLVLATLHVSLVAFDEGRRRLEGPVIHGVEPTGPSRDHHDMFNNYYEDLNLPLDYTGSLLIADGFIQALYVHRGFQSAWKFETVLELVFDAGRFIEAIDRSERMAALRRAKIDDRAPG